MSQEQRQPLNEIQNLHLELFKRSRFNQLDGEHVVRDLLEWRDLWYSVIPMRLPMPYKKDIHGEMLTDPDMSQLALLRGVRYDMYHADMLYIWTSATSVDHLKRLIEEHWEADEIDVFGPDSDPEAVAMHWARLDTEDDRVLRIWWD